MLEDYRRIQELNSTSTGDSWRAQRARLDFVLRLFPFHQTKHLEAVLKPQQSLFQSNLTPYIQCGTNNGQAALVRPFIPGQSLGQFLSTRKAIDPATTLIIVQDCARALNTLHQAGLTHGHLYPENIILDGDLVPHITDAGLHKLPQGLSPRHPRLPTPGFTPPWLYFSPESLVNSLNHDIRSDLYSLGLIAYTMITGQHPFQSEKLRSFVKLIEQHSIKDISEFMRDPYQPCARVIMKMLAKDPKDRPASPVEVLARIAETVGSRLAEFSSLRRQDDEEPITNNQLRLEIQGPTGTQQLFVYPQTELQIGRNKVGDQGQDLCLRHRPADPQQTCLISGRHFGVFTKNQHAGVVDFGSRFGTTLNNELLHPNQAAVLGERNRITVARNLDLDVLVVTPNETDAFDFSSLNGRPLNPSIYLSRPNNGFDHSYLMLTSWARLTLRRGRLEPAPDGQLVLANKEGQVFAVQADGETLLTPGQTLPFRSAQITIHTLRMDDQR